MDTELIFWEQTKLTADKRRRTTLALARLIVNVGDPRPSKRRLQMTATHSILLYGAEKWANAVRFIIIMAFFYTSKAV